MLRLENAALRIDERDTLALEDEARLQLGCREVVVYFRRLSAMNHQKRVSETVTEDGEQKEDMPIDNVLDCDLIIQEAL